MFFLKEIKIKLMKQHRRKRYKIVYIILIIIALALVSAIVFQFLFTEAGVELPNVLTLPELSTLGYMKVSVDAAVTEEGGIVVLTSECYQLSAFTEVEQAESIADGLMKKIGFRPNTHDLMKDALDNFEIKVIMVKIVDLKNNTFFGRLVLRQENRIVSLDSRPSDGIALAVRTDAPIYIKEDLMKSQGRYVC